LTLKEGDLRRVCSTIHSEALHIGSQGCAIWKGIKKPGKHPSAATLLGEEQDIEIGGSWSALEEPCADLSKEAERLWGLGRNLVVDVPECPTESQIGTVIWAALERTETRHHMDELVAETLNLEAQKQSVGQVDFTDMLLRALRRGGAPSRELLIVDEAQDLSPLQIALVNLWSENSNQTVLCGDPDQGIFQFAGADGLYLTGLIRGGVTARSLQQSYRVPGAPHALARRVILLNQDRVDSPYLPMDKPGEVEVCHRLDHALWLVEQMSARGSVFVLARTCARLGEYSAPLMTAGVPFINERGSSPWGQQKLRMTILALADILGGQLVSKERLKALLDSTPWRPRSLIAIGKKKDAVAAVAALEDGAYVPPSDLSRFGLSLPGILECSTLEAALVAIAKLNRDGAGPARPLMDIYERRGIEALLREPLITLTTYHASKGREADTVLVDLGAPYPVVRSVNRGDQKAIESERRALYVAVTRMLDTLLLARADQDLCDLLGVAV
jgi:superfamily I DNA/RNA helicase